jgi:hypothetical protein
VVHYVACCTICATRGAAPPTNCREECSGSLLMVVTDTGSLGVLDVSQAADKRPAHAVRASVLSHLLATPRALAPTSAEIDEEGDETEEFGGLGGRGKQRMKLRATDEDSLLGNEVPMSGGAAAVGGAGALMAGATATAGASTSSPFATGPAAAVAAGGGVHAVVLAPPAPLGTATLLLPPSWTQLLRLVLQLGLSTASLRTLAGCGGAHMSLLGNAAAAAAAPDQAPQPVCDDALSDAVEELISTLPPATRKVNVTYWRHP